MSDKNTLTEQDRARYASIIDGFRSDIAETNGFAGTRIYTSTKRRDHHCVLSDDDIRAIRADARTLEELSAEYGVAPASIWRIKKRTTYRHVTEHQQ